MKETFQSALLLISILVMLVMVSYYETHYTRTGIVVEINNDVITVEDNTGNLWEFEGNGFIVDDVVSMTMHTRGTDNIVTDDEVLSVKVVDKE